VGGIKVAFRVKGAILYSGAKHKPCTTTVFIRGEGGRSKSLFMSSGSTASKRHQEEKRRAREVKYVSHRQGAKSDDGREMKREKERAAQPQRLRTKSPLRHVHSRVP